MYKRPSSKQKNILIACKKDGKNIMNRNASYPGNLLENSIQRDTFYFNRFVFTIIFCKRFCITKKMKAIPDMRLNKIFYNNRGHCIITYIIITVPANYSDLPHNIFL